MGNCCERLFFKPEKPSRRTSSISIKLESIPKICEPDEPKENDIEDLSEDYWKGNIMDILVITKDANTSPIVIEREKSPDICSSFKNKSPIALGQDWMDIQKKLAYEAKEEKEKFVKHREGVGPIPDLISKDILQTKV